MQSFSRRNFLALAGATGVASLLPRSAWAGTMQWPAGIQLYTVGKALAADTPGTLKQLHDIGYRAVECAGTAKATPADFRKMLDDAGLVCPSAHLMLGGPQAEAQYAVAHTLGAHYAVSSVLFTPGQKMKVKDVGLDGFKNLAARMNEVGKSTKAAGLQYAYHNHNFEFEKMPDGSPGYDVLVKETDPELVKFEIDCGWMSVAGANPVDYFKKYPGRFRMLHIKDFKPGTTPNTELMGAGRPLGSDLGKGFVDYAPIFAAGKAAGIEHIFVEQEEPFPVSQMESAKVDYAYLQKFS